MSRLKQGNEALRREDQRLRAKLLERVQHNADGQFGAGYKKVQTPASNQSTAEYWLTIRPKKRHNFKCRSYKKTKGRPCTKDKGSPCRICGG